jgi:hypothetical protein
MPMPTEADVVIWHLDWNDEGRVYMVRGGGSPDLYFDGHQGWMYACDEAERRAACNRAICGATMASTV